MVCALRIPPRAQGDTTSTSDARISISPTGANTQDTGLPDTRDTGGPHPTYKNDQSRFAYAVHNAHSVQAEKDADTVCMCRGGTHKRARTTTRARAQKAHAAHSHNVHTYTYTHTHTHTNIHIHPYTYTCILSVSHTAKGRLAGLHCGPVDVGGHDRSHASLEQHVDHGGADVADACACVRTFMTRTQSPEPYTDPAHPHAHATNATQRNATQRNATQRNATTRTRTHKHTPPRQFNPVSGSPSNS